MTDKDRGAVLHGTADGHKRVLTVTTDITNGQVHVGLAGSPEETAPVQAAASFDLAVFASGVAFVLRDHRVVPDDLKDVIRNAYAHAGDTVFTARLRGENIDLYDAIAQAITDRYVIIEKEV